MKAISSVLLFTLFLLITQSHSSILEFFDRFKYENDFNIQFRSEDFVCIENGVQIINSSLQLLNNYHNQTSEDFLLSALNLYQQSEETLSKCKTTLDSITANFSQLLQNQERIRNNLNNHFPHIIQSLSSSILLFINGHYGQSGLVFDEALTTIFVNPYTQVRKFYKPNKTVEFEPERFYEEFTSDFLERVLKLKINETMTKGVAKCLSKNALILHAPKQERKIFEKLLETLLNIPDWFEGIENCILSENIDITFLKNFLQFYVNDWKNFIREGLEETLTTFQLIHKLFINGIEKIVEGEYSNAGNLFARGFSRIFRTGIQRYLDSLQREFWEDYSLERK